MTTLEKIEKINEKISDLIITYMNEGTTDLYLLEQALNLTKEVKRELGEASQ